jgi:hypothetical protein
MKFDRAWARRLVAWSRPWTAFEAKVDPEQPSTGSLVTLLGDELEAAIGRLDRVTSELFKLQLDAQRWLNESEDRANLRAAESRIERIVELAQDRPSQDQEQLRRIRGLR